MANGLDLIVALNHAVHPMGIMQRITDRTMELIPPARGAMVGLADESGVTYVCGAGNQRELVGTHVGLGSSLSGLAVRTGRIQQTSDTETDLRVDIDACRAHHVRSLVCVPLRREGNPVGVLAINAPDPDAFSDQHLRTLERFADFIGVAIGSAHDLYEVSAHLIDHAPKDDLLLLDGMDPAEDAAHYVMSVLSPEAVPRLDSRERIEHVLDAPDLLSIVFQPIVDLHTDRTAAVEALARFDIAPYRSPDQWFAEAQACGLGVDLELAAIERAFGFLRSLDEDTSMTVNVGPKAVCSPRFVDLLDDVPKEQVILELTEHAIVDDYPELVGQLGSLRAQGVRIAIDDTGSGYSSLRHILKVAPDLIKLDCELTTSIDRDPVRRALAASLVAFAAETDAEIVAEGIETDDELLVFRRLGVRYAQGFHLGRPAPIRTRRSYRP